MERTTPDFEHFVTVLADSGVDFVIVGGFAMVLHGSNYMTSDIDFAISRDRENLKKVAEALSRDHPKPEGWPDDLPFIWDEETIRRATILTLQTDRGSIDLLGETPGVASYQELSGRAVFNEVYGKTIKVASIDDLISMKQAANRPKDQGHILELKALKNLTQPN